MKKRSSTILILAILVFIPAHRVQAQKQASIPRIGVLLLGAPPNVNLDAFIQGLRDLGYIQGKNIFIEQRFAEGKSIGFLNSQGTLSDSNWTRCLQRVRQPFSRLRMQHEQFLSFSSALVIRSGRALSPVSRTQGEISRVSPF